MIANFHKLSFVGSVAIALLVVFGLALSRANAQPPATRGASGPPRIIATSPKSGAADVDPGLKEITVTFDRDMDSGMSWTGGGPALPKSPEGSKAHWRDKRTCVLPVVLQSGRAYRVGFNSKSYQNFRDVDGVAATPSAIAFRTSGLPGKTKAPEIVAIDPPNGATDVNPAVTELRVTFNIAMGHGMSWVGEVPNFPGSPEGKKPYWTDGGKTCVLPVVLRPGWKYALSLNSRSFQGFQSEDGVALAPVAFRIETGDAR
jgi:hypothetical protein